MYKMGLIEQPLIITPVPVFKGHVGHLYCDAILLENGTDLFKCL